jgi:two-component system response regulator FixJ
MTGPAQLVFIVDDDPAVRESLSLLLQTEGLLARTFASARDFLADAPETLRGCLVTDVRMAGMTGLELLAQVKRSASHLPVVVITAYGDVPIAVEAMKLGATDFLEKPYSDLDFIAAVRGALDEAANAEARAAHRIEMARRFETLTEPERRVFAGLLEGKLNKTAAFEMGVSLRTVEALRASVMAKLGAECLSDLVRTAMRAGLDKGGGGDGEANGLSRDAPDATGPSAQP